MQKEISKYDYENKFSRNSLTLMYDYCIILPEDEQNRVWSVAFLMKGSDAYFIRTSFIYILFIELAIVTVVAIALFVALVVTIRKLDNEKNTSLLGR